MESDEAGTQESGAPKAPTGDDARHGALSADTGRQGPNKKPGRSRVSRAVVQLSQVYMLGYFVLVVIAVAADVLLRRQVNDETDQAVAALAVASTALYFLALALLLVGYSARLRVLRRRSAGLKLLYAGVAALLIARGYFSAGVVLPKIQREPWPAILADVGLLGATLIVLGLVASAIDAVRFALVRAARVRPPRLRRKDAGD